MHLQRVSNPVKMYSEDEPKHYSWGREIDGSEPLVDVVRDLPGVVGLHESAGRLIVASVHADRLPSIDGDKAAMERLLEEAQFRFPELNNKSARITLEGFRLKTHPMDYERTDQTKIEFDVGSSLESSITQDHVLLNKQRKKQRLGAALTAPSLRYIPAVECETRETAKLILPELIEVSTELDFGRLILSPMVVYELPPLPD